MQRLAACLLIPIAVLGSSGATKGVARSAPPLDSLAHYYVNMEPAGIRRLLGHAHDREERLLCTYRLYPLTRDRALVADIPAASEARTAREAALIAALWAFRIHASPPWSLPTYGRRSESALNVARRLDADDPYVLLVEGQSLLYKPAIFGGDAAAARERFERLRGVLARRPAIGIHPVEAEVWVWMAMRRLHSPGTEQFRLRLLADAPPPLFRQFLTDPP